MITNLIAEFGHITDILQADLVHHPMGLTMLLMVIDILPQTTEVTMVFHHLLMEGKGQDHAHHSHIDRILKIIKYKIQVMVSIIKVMLIEYIADL